MKLNEEDGPPGAATLDNVVGRDPYDFGNNPQDGNSDQRRGSGEAFSITSRELTKEEKAMLDMTKKLANGDTQIAGYKAFREEMLKEHFVTPNKLKRSINAQFGDFSAEAHKIVQKIPVINGLIDTRTVDVALTRVYPKAKVGLLLESLRSS